MNVKGQFLQGAERHSHDPGGPALPGKVTGERPCAQDQHTPITSSQNQEEPRLPRGRGHFYRNYFWKCKPFVAIYSLSIFMSLKPMSRYFTKGNFCTSADLFLPNSEMAWKRELILSHKHNYFGIPSFSSPVPWASEREGKGCERGRTG